MGFSSLDCLFVALRAFSSLAFLRLFVCAFIGSLGYVNGFLLFGLSVCCFESFFFFSFPLSLSSFTLSYQPVSFSTLLFSFQMRSCGGRCRFVLSFFLILPLFLCNFSSRSPSTC